MCRLVGFSSHIPVMIENYIFQMRRFSQAGNAVGQPKVNIAYSQDGPGSHPDGWGIVCLDRRGQLLSPVKSDRPAYADPELSEFASVASSLWIGHVRRASPGILITPAHAHPFEHEGVVLAHNGSFYGVIYEQAKENESSDTELFLHELVQYWKPRTLSSLADALPAILEDKDLVGTFDAANLLIAEGKTFYGLRWFNAKGDYYTLYVRQKPDRVELSSQPFFHDDQGWRLLENRELIAIQDGDVVERIIL